MPSMLPFLAQATVAFQMTMTISNPQAFVADALARQGVQAAIAQVASVPRSWVTVALSLAAGSNGTVNSTGARRLAAGSVLANSTVAVPFDMPAGVTATGSGIAGALASAGAAGLEAAVESQVNQLVAQAGGTNYSVVVASVSQFHTATQTRTSTRSTSSTAAATTRVTAQRHVEGAASQLAGDAAAAPVTAISLAVISVTVIGVLVCCFCQLRKRKAHGNSSGKVRPLAPGEAGVMDKAVRHGSSQENEQPSLRKAAVVVAPKGPLYNDERAEVHVGDNKYGGNGTARFYCGRYVGPEAISNATGICGPHDGPQCRSCHAMQERRMEQAAWSSQRPPQPPDGVRKEDEVESEFTDTYTDKALVDSPRTGSEEDADGASEEGSAESHRQHHEESSHCADAALAAVPVPMKLLARVDAAPPAAAEVVRVQLPGSPTYVTNFPARRTPSTVGQPELHHPSVPLNVAVEEQWC